MGLTGAFSSDTLETSNPELGGDGRNMTRSHTLDAGNGGMTTGSDKDAK